MRLYKVTKYVVHRDCEHFFLRVPPACFGRAEGSMAGTPLELSENSLQNLLYEVFCHLVNKSTLRTLASIAGRM